jgi:putative transcriptional regulator
VIRRGGTFRSTHSPSRIPVLAGVCGLSIGLWEAYRSEGAVPVGWLRFEHGEMTQQQLAEIAQCTRQTILALEQEKYVPSLALAFRIARAFGLGVEEVFEYEE